MNKKQIGAALLAGIVAVGMLAGCGSDKKAADNNKPLKVATNATFVPFEFQDD